MHIQKEEWFHVFFLLAFYSVSAYTSLFARAMQALNFIEVNTYMLNKSDIKDIIEKEK